MCNPMVQVEIEAQKLRTLTLEYQFLQLLPEFDCPLENESVKMILLLFKTIFSRPGWSLNCHLPNFLKY